MNKNNKLYCELPMWDRFLIWLDKLNKMKLKDFRKKYLGKKEIHSFYIPGLHGFLQIYLSNKGKASFIKDCEKMSELLETPLFTFKCRKCNVLKSIIDIGCPVVFKNKDRLLDINFYCKSCDEKGDKKE